MPVMNNKYSVTGIVIDGSGTEYTSTPFTVPLGDEDDIMALGFRAGTLAGTAPTAIFQLQTQDDGDDTVSDPWYNVGNPTAALASLGSEYIEYSNVTGNKFRLLITTANADNTSVGGGADVFSVHAMSTGS